MTTPTPPTEPKAMSEEPLNSLIGRIESAAVRAIRSSSRFTCKPKAAHRLCLSLRSALATIDAQRAEIERLKERFATKEDLIQVCDQGHVWRTAYGPPCPFCARLDTLKARAEAAERERDEFKRGYQSADKYVEFLETDRDSARTWSRRWKAAAKGWHAMYRALDGAVSTAVDGHVKANKERDALRTKLAEAQAKVEHLDAACVQQIQVGDALSARVSYIAMMDRAVDCECCDLLDSYLKDDAPSAEAARARWKAEGRAGMLKEIATAFNEHAHNLRAVEAGCGHGPKQLAVMNQKVLLRRLLETLGYESADIDANLYAIRAAAAKLENGGEGE